MPKREGRHVKYRWRRWLRGHEPAVVTQFRPRHGVGRYRAGKYRYRTWLRLLEPMWLYDRYAIPKGPTDCGNHEFYNSDNVVDRCYHCEVGLRPHTPPPDEDSA